MPTSAEQIADLIAAYTDLKQFYEGVRGAIQAQSLGAIAALRAGLNIGLFVDAATGDDDPARTGSSSQPLRTLRAALDRVVVGATNRVFLQAGQTHVYTDAPGAPRTGGSAFQRMPGALALTIERTGDGADPVLQIGAYQDPGGVNHLAAWIDVIQRFDLGFRSIKLELPVPPNPLGAIDPANRFLLWPVGSMRGAFVSINFNSCDVTVPAGGFALIPAAPYATLMITISATTLRGGGVLAPGTEPTAIVAVRGATSVGATKVLNSGLVGQGVLTNNPAFVL